VDQPGSRLFAVQFSGTLPAFDAAFAQLRRALGEARIANTPRFKIELAFEEVVANIVRHAAPPDGGVADIRVVLDERDGALVLTFDDNGAPFDPRARPDPTPPRSLDEARIGGLGIMMVRRTTTMDYVRTTDGHNRLIVTIESASDFESASPNARASD